MRSKTTKFWLSADYRLPTSLLAHLNSPLAKDTEMPNPRVWKTSDLPYPVLLPLLAREGHPQPVLATGDSPIFPRFLSLCWLLGTLPVFPGFPQLPPLPCTYTVTRTSCFQEEDSKLAQESPPTSSESWMPFCTWLSLAQKPLRWGVFSRVSGYTSASVGISPLSLSQPSSPHPCFLHGVSLCSIDGQGCSDSPNKHARSEKQPCRSRAGHRAFPRENKPSIIFSPPGKVTFGRQNV